eukprot:scaffold21715_cov66-Phaeocystis_antarctica.AAC.3
MGLPGRSCYAPAQPSRHDTCSAPPDLKQQERTDRALHLRAELCMWECLTVVVCSAPVGPCNAQARSEGW